MQNMLKRGTRILEGLESLPMNQVCALHKNSHLLMQNLGVLRHCFYPQITQIFADYFYS